MKTTELSKYRGVLEAKQADLAQMVRNRVGITIEKSADALDEVQNAVDRELAVRNLDRDFNLLRMSAQRCAPSKKAARLPGSSLKVSDSRPS